MPKKTLQIDGIGTVAAYKRRGTRSVRIRIAPDGTVRITQPHWLPYRAAKEFAQAKRHWIAANRPVQTFIEHDDVIGKYHQVKFSYEKRDTVSIRVRDNIIKVLMPLGAVSTASSVQHKIHSACERALRKEAHEYLPDRTAVLADMHNFSYGKVSVKKMTSRWGSCSSQHNISLNIYLMQLSDDLIDYVLLHELTHTRILTHGQTFWDELRLYVPKLDEIRRVMRQQAPSISVNARVTKD